MTSTPEHFCTLFDSGFLPQAVVLHRSLREHCPESVLWALCMDEKAAGALKRLALANVRILRIADLETPELLAARANRSWGEYCWTVTPHLLAWMLEREGVDRATYLDADLLFLSSPMELIEEMVSASGQILITPHDYGFGYGRPELFGVHCVQFVTAANRPEVRQLLDEWAGQCREWCYASKDGRGFGDQKYLDEWPRRGAMVHVLEACSLAHGPWRHSLLPWSRRGMERHVFHHFHKLRIFAGRRVRLFRGYRIPASRRGDSYAIVERMLGEAIDLLEANGLCPVFPVVPAGWRCVLERALLRILDLEGWVRV